MSKKDSTFQNQPHKLSCLFLVLIMGLSLSTPSSPASVSGTMIWATGRGWVAKGIVARCFDWLGYKSTIEMHGCLPNSDNKLEE